MNSRLKVLLLGGLLVLGVVATIPWMLSTSQGTPPANTKKEPYLPTWNSLRKHQTPSWLLDAKFGIYSHVSLETIKNVAGNEDKYKHELIEDFKLVHFDAAEWAELFQRTGAKFAGPVAWHGSGFLHWDSDITSFNAVDMGPGIDLVGELKREIHARNMKFIASFHTGYWYRAAIDQDNPGRKNPKYIDLYGPEHDTEVKDAIPWKNHIEKQSKVNRFQQDSWLAKMKEAVTKYHPDIAWVDVSFGGTLRGFNKGRYKHGKLISNEEIYMNGMPESHQRNYIAHLFNTAQEHNQEVAFVYKEYDVPPGVGMRNIENGLLDQLTYDTWMTDIDICEPVSWFYKEGMTIKNANTIIDILVDVTAKNGILLLNVPPKADGTFADFIVRELLEVGNWLEVHGEAIYGSMPWTVYGEGPSFLAKTGHYSEKVQNAAYTADDFRFTQNGNTLYATCLGIPQGQITIQSLGTRGRLFEGDILSVELIGHEGKIEYQHNPMDLTIRMPDDFKGKYACVFKIERKP